MPAHPRQISLLALGLESRFIWAVEGLALVVFRPREVHVLTDRGPGLLSVTSFEGHLGYSPLTSLILQWEVREPAPTTPLPREKGESMFQAERKWSSQ